ncbi:uncharacterized protein LOC133182870 isoform X2 [Saccostrea echinata]|uniref:uncharacterized protein LOC133182870 isoform X2 n=1 Tax=Saccostrea echinata TaxID=191078 RepID=UPI002A82CE4A|nr:uncharacterized protein LOC133182870 isoform X2 [Saccostrea echinata]
MVIFRKKHRNFFLLLHCQQRMSSGYNKDLVTALRDVVNETNWYCAGPVAKLKKYICNRYYADGGEDIVVIYSKKSDKFYALGAVCSHEGGPLEQGDIEDFDGREKIVCPWHSYDFDLETGESSYGLKQDVYEVCIKDDQLYFYTGSELSTKPFKSPVIKKDTTQTETKTDKTVKDEDTTSLTYWASKILNTACPQQKVELTQKVGEMWRKGELTVGFCHPPDQPARDEGLTVVKPGKERKRGKGGSLTSRISSLHSMANIEQWAIDLSWDIIARFSTATPDGCDEALPQGFYDDFVQVACDEAKHYKMLSDRLQDLGSYFGALPVHNALWSAATDTSDSLLARLAIVHMVHEARGLDVQPKILEKFAKNNDPESAAILEVIFRDEITHVAAGLRWFTYVCSHSNPPLNFFSGLYSNIS